MGLCRLSTFDREWAKMPKEDTEGEDGAKDEEVIAVSDEGRGV